MRGSRDQTPSRNHGEEQRMAVEGEAPQGNREELADLGPDSEAGLKSV
jgi:hypothetical protein